MKEITTLNLDEGKEMLFTNELKEKLNDGYSVEGYGCLDRGCPTQTMILILSKNHEGGLYE